MSDQQERKRCARCDGIGRVPVRLAFAGICPACHGNGWVGADQCLHEAFDSRYIGRGVYRHECNDCGEINNVDAQEWGEG